MMKGACELTHSLANPVSHPTLVHTWFGSPKIKKEGTSKLKIIKDLSLVLRKTVEHTGSKL